MALFALYACIIKYIMKGWYLSTPELTYYVSLMMLILLAIGVRYAKQDVFSIAKQAQFDLVCRAGAGFLSDVLLFVAFHYTSYSKAFCLFFTCPLMCPFLARCLLGERIKLWDVIAVVLGFIGTLMLVQPFKETDEDAQSDIIGCIIGLCSAFFAALAIVYLRKLAERIHFTLVPLYNMLFATLLAPVWSTLAPTTEVEQLPVYSLSMFLTVVFGVLVYNTEQVIIAKSMQYNTVGAASIIMYLAIPIGYFLDWIVFDRDFGGLELGGAGVICLSNIVISFMRVKGYID